LLCSSIELVEFSLLLSCSYTLSLLHLEAIQPVLEKKREREKNVQAQNFCGLLLLVLFFLFSFFFGLQIVVVHNGCCLYQFLYIVACFEFCA